MKTKVCTKCNNEYPLTKEFFHKDNNSKDGYCTRCKKCINKYKHLSKIKTRECKNCGKSYVGYKLYCSDDCKKEYRIKNGKKYKHICLICGKEYVNKNLNSKFCSYECRQKSNKSYSRICKQCGKVFFGTKESNFCSNKCVNEHNRIHPKIKCEHCGKLFSNSDNRIKRRFCSRECFLKHINTTKWEVKCIVSDVTHIRRAKKFNVRYEKINPVEIFERDKWVCGICGKKVDKYLAYPNKMSASLDHITPLSKGGTHTKDNVQLAHLGCNLKKGDSL